MVFPAKRQPDYPSDKSPFHKPEPISREVSTYMWADYYARVAEEFEKAVKDTSGPHFAATAHELLAGVAQESTLDLLMSHTDSREWKKSVLPLIKEPADTISALLSYLQSLHWEKAVVHSFIPEVELVIEITGEDNAAPGAPICSLNAGAASAIMDLLYGSGPGFREKLYSFVCVETKCRRKGDSLCRFEVRRNPHHGQRENGSADYRIHA